MFPAWEKLKKISDEITAERGLSIIRLPDTANKGYYEWSAEKLGISWKAKLRDIINQTANVADSFEDLLDRLRSQEYLPKSQLPREKLMLLAMRNIPKSTTDFTQMLTMKLPRKQQLNLINQGSNSQQEPTKTTPHLPLTRATRTHFWKPRKQPRKKKERSRKRNVLHRQLMMILNCKRRKNMIAVIIVSGVVLIFDIFAIALCKASKKAENMYKAISEKAERKNE